MNMMTDSPLDVMEDLDAMKIAAEEAAQQEEARLEKRRQYRWAMTVMHSIDSTTPGGFHPPVHIKLHFRKHICRYIAAMLALFGWAWLMTHT